nr:helix-turn-helix domain-containing protein [Vibrio parahaemolyticus]
MRLVKILFSYVKKHGLSQRELAERAGITHSAISSIENGKVSPSVSSLQKNRQCIFFITVGVFHF